MDKSDALVALTALSQETRLDVFRLLIQTGSDGLLAGEIADKLNTRQNTMSSHLAILHRAGLIVSEREGRMIHYRANYEGMRSLLSFLVEDCCKGEPSICTRLLAEFENKC